MRPLLVLFGVTMGAAECNRAPAEDFRPASVEAPHVPASSGGYPPSREGQRAGSVAPAARCVAWTPSVPPSPVSPGPAPGCPPDPEAHPPSVATTHLTFPEVSGVGVDAEIVRTEHDTTRGLMYRTSLPEEGGMLFDLQERTDHRFWMHNTCIPLDMLFVDEDGLIVGIVENAPTLNDDPRSVGCPSRWVLEVNAGWSRRHGVKAGGHLMLP